MIPGGLRMSSTWLSKPTTRAEIETDICFRYVVHCGDTSVK